MDVWRGPTRFGGSGLWALHVEKGEKGDGSDNRMVLAMLVLTGMWAEVRLSDVVSKLQWINGRAINVAARGLQGALHS